MYAIWYVQKENYTKNYNEDANYNDQFDFSSRNLPT